MSKNATGIEFPPWAVKMSAAHPRAFSESVMRRGEMVIPLQYGTNKCASQKVLKTFRSLKFTSSRWLRSSKKPFFLEVRRHQSPTIEHSANFEKVELGCRVRNVNNGSYWQSARILNFCSTSFSTVGSQCLTNFHSIRPLKWILLNSLFLNPEFFRRSSKAV